MFWQRRALASKYLATGGRSMLKNDGARMPDDFGTEVDILRHSYGYLRGDIDANGKVFCTEPAEQYETVPTYCPAQSEVVRVQDLIEDIIGSTFQTDKVARALLRETQNPQKIVTVLEEYKADRKFCGWAMQVGLRAFAFKSMVLTKYHATPKARESKDWYELNRNRINR